MNTYVYIVLKKSEPPHRPIGSGKYTNTRTMPPNRKTLQGHSSSTDGSNPLGDDNKRPMVIYCTPTQSLEILGRFTRMVIIYYLHPGSLALFVIYAKF